MNLEEFINSKAPLKNAQEIVFFGGSFHPWHQGHSACVELLPKDKALIVLPDHNPYKELVSDKLSEPQAIKNTVEQIRGEAFVYQGFLKANKKNPTYSWLKELKESMPEKDLSLLMGFDTFTGIDHWIEAEKLLKLLSSIYVASRMDNDRAKESQVKRLKSINHALKIHFLGHHPHEELSSTQIRQHSK